MRKLYIIFFIILISAITSLSQGKLKILGSINTESFPTLKMEFTIIMPDGTILPPEELSINDIQLYDNKNLKKGELECLSGEYSKFSTILVIDRSPTMNCGPERDPTLTAPRGTPSKMEIAIEAAETWIKELPSSRFECAIVAFDNSAYIVNQFTKDKNELLNGLTSDLFNPNNIISLGTNYYAAFLNNTQGALSVGAKAKYPLFIIFLTDGEHNAYFRYPFKLVSSDVSARAKALKASINSIIIGNTAKINQTSFDCIQSFSDTVYSTQQTDLTYFYRQILDKIVSIPNIPPCQYSWFSDCNGGNVEFHIKNRIIDTTVYLNYVAPDNQKAFIEFNPPVLETITNCKNDTTLTFTITARKNDISFLDEPTFEDHRFSLLSYFNRKDLYKNQSREITIFFRGSTKPDTIFKKSKMFFPSSSCEKPFIELSTGLIFLRPCDCGSTKINTPKEIPFKESFVNRGGKKVLVIGGEFIGKDSSVFSFKSLPKDSVDNNSGLDIVYVFTPIENRSYQSTIKLYLSDSTSYSAHISGTGTGYPIISSLKNIDNLSIKSCNTQFLDTTILIHNKGELPLIISSIKLDPPSNEFKILTNPLPSWIEPALNGQTMNYDSLKLRFEPVSAGNKSIDLVISSNSQEDTLLVIPIKAYKDSLYFTADKQSIDLGVLCPNETITQKILVSAPGTTLPVGINISATGNLKNDNLSSSQLNLQSNSSKDFEITVSSLVEGSFNGTIELKDDSCAKLISIPVKWQIAAPSISKTGLTFSVNLPESQTQTLTLTNNSKRDIIISDTNFANKEFYFSQPCTLPLTIPANGGNAELDVTFTPDIEGIFNSNLLIKGTPCGFCDTIPINGSSTSSKSQIAIDEYSGLVGQSIDVDLWLRNNINFDLMQTNNINTTIGYDTSIIKPISVKNGKMSLSNGEITISDIPVLTSNDPQLIETVRFLIVDNETGSKSELSIKNPEAKNGKIFFDIKNGLINVLGVSAEIIAGEISAAPGDNILLPITFKNINNFDNSFHKSISLKLKFNKTLIEPIAASPASTDFGNERIADIIIPLTSINKDPITMEYPFRAMLGDSKSTLISIDSAKFDQGKLQAQIENGKLTLLTCNAGGDRLFNPSGIEAKIATPIPNPAMGIVELEFQTSEDGITDIGLSNQLGERVLNILNEYLKSGSHSITFDISNLSSGLYFIRMKTATQIITTQFNIIK